MLRSEGRIRITHQGTLPRPDDLRTLVRARGSGAEKGVVHAIDLKGLALGEAPFSFAPDARETDAVLDLPVEIRNDVARLEIAGERSAGAVQLLAKRWRRRTVGVVSGAGADRSQPLLGATYYLQRALNPFADVRLAEGVAPAEAINRFLDLERLAQPLGHLAHCVEALQERRCVLTVARVRARHLGGRARRLGGRAPRRGPGIVHRQTAASACTLKRPAGSVHVASGRKPAVLVRC